MFRCKWTEEDIDIEFTPGYSSTPENEMSILIGYKSSEIILLIKFYLYIVGNIKFSTAELFGNMLIQFPQYWPLTLFYI
jgi:hypothetical protein